jgi:predicted type IV restriction endonuclease
MNNLNEALTPIVEKIKKFRSLYEQNEMAVRDQIVNPILRSLG